MKESKIDGLMFFAKENIRYSASYRCIWWPTKHFRELVVLGREGGPVLFTAGQDIERALSVMPWMGRNDIRPGPTLEDHQIVEGATAGPIKKALQEMNLSDGRIGIDVVTVDILRSLQTALPKAEFVDANTCISDAKVVKNEEEIKLFRASCACSDAGMEAGLASIRPGMRGGQIYGEILRVYTALGCEATQCSSIVSSGSETAPLTRLVSDKLVGPGDTVFIDVGGCFNGMFSELTRTVVCEKPNAQQRKIYAALLQAIETAIKSMKPGVKASKVVRNAAQVFDDTGFGEVGSKNILGHSIGTSGFEFPVLGDVDHPGSWSKTDFELRPGMVFSVEPTISQEGVPGGGGMRIEDEVLITETGQEVLTKTPYDERLS